MSYPINYPTPQGANVQIFANNNTTGSAAIASAQDWVKPQGASFVWFTLIGGGAGGASSFGGGSGAVTNFMCPAFLIPDALRIIIGGGGTSGNDGGVTSVIYQQKSGAGYTLLTANGGTSGSSGGTAMSANAFTAMGFFQSIAGQTGASTGISASTTTFLSAGNGTSGSVTSNYGYTTATSGIFQMQPIIIGAGGNASSSGGIGCGGGNTGRGGPGMVVIITW